MRLLEKIDLKIRSLIESRLKEIKHEQSEISESEVVEVKTYNEEILDKAKEDIYREDKEWEVFVLNGETFLRGCFNEIKIGIITKLNPENKSIMQTPVLEKLDQELDLWRIKQLKSTLISKMDFFNQRHEENEYFICPAKKFNDDKLFQFLLQDIMNLYDPCVVERIWKADTLSDSTFLKKLGQTIGAYISSNHDFRNNFHYVKYFLSEMERVGLLNLSYSSNLKNPSSQNDWELAFECVSSWLEGCSILKTKHYFRSKNDFIDAFSPAFDIDSPAIYNEVNLLNRMRVHEVIETVKG